MKKRILPALLALCMVMSLLPMTLAANPTQYACNTVPANGSTAKKDSPATDRTTDYKVDGKTVQVTTTVHTVYAVDPVGHTCAHPVGCTCYTEAAEATKGAPGSVTATTTGEGEDATTTYTNEVTDTVKVTYAMCDVCKANAACNPCDGTKDCDAATHNAGCKAACNKGGCTLPAGHDEGENATDHNGTGCTKDEHCVAAKHEVGCPKMDACKDHTENDEGGVANCTLPYNHKGPHNVKTCTQDERCPVSEGHEDGCPMRCTKQDAAKKMKDDGTFETGDTAGTKCDRTKDHSGVCNNTVCVGNANCGAATHVESADAVKDKDGKVTTPAIKGCPNEKSVCGVGGCTKTKGHVGDHNNTVCLGYNGANGECPENLTQGADGKTAKHIAGCKWYVCECGAAHTHANFKPTATKCTHKAGCPHCNEWNAFVTKQNAKVAEYEKYVKDKAAYDKLTDEQKKNTTAPTVVADPGAKATACTCKDCRPNPAMGAVVDAAGETVDPADSTTEIPTKAEDFKDADKMDDWMKEAAQVMLDKGWMQGTTEGNFDPREEAATNMVLTVVARMSGETITGATWADDAKAWAEKNELTEGIEITKSDIARKDIVLMLWRLAGKPGSEQALDDFTDVDGLENDYLTAMKWAVEKKIVLGNGDGTVTPDGTLKRAELAALVARYAALEK